MHVNEYIESGIIESYVLGLANEQEAAELEQLATTYSEIKSAINRFETEMENYALNHATPPPAVVKENIWQALANEWNTEEESDSSATLHQPEVSTPIITMAQNTAKWKYIAAASVILLVASVMLNYKWYASFRESDTKYQALLLEKNSLEAGNDLYKTKLDETLQSMALLQNKDLLAIKLLAIKGKEGNEATVYWNKNTGDLYLYETAMSNVPAGKQYQLWALVDGKPVDAGVFGGCNGLCKMKNIPRAQAFAVTLEKEGGSEAPTLAAMYVLGNV